MRVLVATDAWHPQVNGVVRTLAMMAEAARPLGVDVNFLTPQSFRTVALPSYPDLRLAMPGPAAIARLIGEARPDSIHIATEGPIGLATRRYCRKQGLPFTTSFHTRFPEYISARLPIPESWIWAALRWFHGASQAVMAATPALASELRVRGFRNVVLWPRGVDTTQFRPRAVDLGLPRPVFLCVGRVAVEKNLEAFLGLDLPGTKLIVGDGPARAGLPEISASGVPVRGRAKNWLRSMRRRRVRVSEPDRHFRPGAARSAGQRPAGRRVPGDRASRCDRFGTGRLLERGFAGGVPAGCDFAAGLRAFAAGHSWEASARPSSKCANARREPEGEPG
jgi:glycosyltransferase involved in cell wall biosynthesis